MKFETNKEKGNTGLAMAIAYFGSQGYTVSVPLNDTQDYDLIVEIDEILNKVQVKSTGFKDKKDSYRVNLRGKGGTKGETYKTVKDTQIDLLFVFCEDYSMYLIPIEKIVQESSISLIKTKNKYASKNSIDYSEYIVKF